MKKALPSLLISIGVIAVITSLAVAAIGKPKELRHVVSFKFKTTATGDDMGRVQIEFASLKNRISEIKSLEFGQNVSPEKLDRGHTHCFIVTFGSEQDRDAYLVHPAHEKFVKLLLPVLEEAFVVDFWAHR
jgi:hypothetical protein